MVEKPLPAPGQYRHDLHHYVRDILRSGIVPSDLRATLFRSLVLIPGMEVVDERANLDGRTGIAVSRSEGDERVDFIFDRSTGEVIGERTVDESSNDDGGAPGSVTASSAVSTKVVRSTP